LVWIASFDPRLIMQLMFFDCTPHQDNLKRTLLRLPMYKAYLSTLNNPMCFCLSSNEIMLIVNSGASVCISPLCLDFVTYKSSIMKIKDLLSSKRVEGEGIIEWNVIDKHKHNVAIDVPGYHIPGADIHLSPQVLVQRFGGSFLGLPAGISLSLNNDLELEAKYCPRSLPPFFAPPIYFNATKVFLDKCICIHSK
jgi:hypothetical protein